MTLKAELGRGPVVNSLSARALEFPTDRPESDGTFRWNSTTMVVVEIEGGGKRGLGYTYADRAAAELVNGKLGQIVRGRDVFTHPALYAELGQATRNLGRSGVAATAISAIDIALWDLKARVLDVSAAALLGLARPRVPIYGSGGFTSYSTEEIIEQLGGWVAAGITRVKMKVGRDAAADPGRVRAARTAIGPQAELFVDANGAYTRKQALGMAASYADLGVTWFEEPVSSDDLEGLRLLRDRGPGHLAIAAGEYGFVSSDFLRLLDAGAIDVLQADVTRCGGFTGFLRVAALCDARGIPLSGHTAPAAHLPVCCAAPRLAHLEYFHDHVRIERQIFDGAVAPIEGLLAPALDRPGLGLELRRQDVERFAT
jgi:L-alanine-DL-glutamate epimerase-like enolase superfamily enzyme